MASMGLAAIIIHEATITPSVKNDRASLIFRLLRVERYRYVTKKFADVTMEEFKTRNTPISPISTLPIAVNRARAEKGVIIAQPGKTSFAFRSTAHTTESSFRYLL